jgi:hypothetical protein
MHRQFRPRALALLVLLTILALLPGAVSAAPATPAASPATENATLTRAVDWLLTQQGDDGGFVGLSGKADASTTSDGLIALAAAKHALPGDAAKIDAAIAKGVKFLGTGDTALVFTQTGPGQAAKFTLALIAAGQNPRDLARVDPLVIVEHGQHKESGIYGTGLFDHALCLLALTAAGDGDKIPASAIDALASTQAENGGWAYDGGTDPTKVDGNTTALVIQALVATGHKDSDLVRKGMSYLASTEAKSGAYAFNDQSGSAPDANSTAFALQALIATGANSSDALKALSAFQNDSGALRYNDEQKDDNLLSTIQAIPALAGQAFPITPARTSAVTPLSGVAVVLRPAA